MFSPINISKVLASQIHSLHLNSLKLQGIEANLCSLEKWKVRMVCLERKWNYILNSWVLLNELLTKLLCSPQLQLVLVDFFLEVLSPFPASCLFMTFVLPSCSFCFLVYHDLFFPAFFSAWTLANCANLLTFSRVQQKNTLDCL